MTVRGGGKKVPTSATVTGPPRPHPTPPSHTHAHTHTQHEKFILTFYFHYASRAGCCPVLCFTSSYSNHTATATFVARPFLIIPRLANIRPVGPPPILAALLHSVQKMSVERLQPNGPFSFRAVFSDSKPLLLCLKTLLIHSGM